MCRLFGYKTEDSKKTNDLLIKALKDFCILSENGCVPCGIKKGHNDGWGIIAYKNNAPCFYYRSTASIKVDNNFKKIISLLEEIKPDIVISHLRKMSTGLKTIENTQPFLSNTFSLSHNGTIIYKNSKNTNKSDSLLFFNSIINKNLFSLASFNKIYRNTSLKNNYTAMNMIFSDGINIFAVKNINEKHIQSSKLGFNKYYTLYSFVDTKVSFVCSEKIPSLKLIEEKNLINKNIYKY